MRRPEPADAVPVAEAAARTAITAASSPRRAPRVSAADRRLGGVGHVRLHDAAFRDRRRGHRPGRAAQGRDEQGTPGRSRRSRSGCWSTRPGSRSRCICFEGNTAETTTLLPVLRAFQERHGVTGMVVVADAGMLSAGNLNAIEDAGFSFIVGSRITKAPYDLAEHFARHGDYFTDGQILESSRVMGTGQARATRRVVYQWSFKRSQARRQGHQRPDRPRGEGRRREGAAGQDPVPEGHRRHARNWTRPPSTGPASWPG